MIGHIVPGTGWTPRVKLCPERVLDLPLLRAELPGADEKPRHVRRVARALRKRGVRRVLVPPGFLYWDILENQGLIPVETGDFCRTLAVPAALAALTAEGVRAETATVVFRGERVTRSMRMAALSLCPQVRHLLIAAPVGGEALRRELRREFGVPALEDGPARRPHLAVHFTPAAGRGERVVDLAGPEPALEGFGFSHRTETLPGDCQTLPLLCALWESGRLDPADIVILANFST